MKTIMIKPSDQRLLRGYAPGVFLALAFLLMALLVPTVAPEGDTVGATSKAVPSMSSLTGNAGTAGATAPGATGAGKSGGAAGTRGGSGGVTGSSTPGGKVSGCGGQQVKGDPYSPPCVEFSGNNGGATSHGVTSNSITVTYRTPSDSSNATAAVQQLAGKYNSATFSDTPAQTVRTIEDLATYFNKKFQFYGRKIVMKPFTGVGQELQEVLDSGQSGANADALTAARTYGAFADVSSTTQPYAQALSAQHVVNIGAAYMSNGWFQQQYPYSWSYYPTCTDLAKEASAVATKQLNRQSVTFAGTGVSNGSPRKYALLVPDNPVYQSCANQVKAAMQAAGRPVALDLSYPLDLSQLSSSATSVEQQLVANKITTVIFGGDPIMIVYLTADLDSANYQPEFFNIGAGYTDEDVVGQLFDQKTWAHAAGVTNNGQTPPYGSSLGYFAVKSVDPGFAPAHMVDIYYEDMYILALGIQGAGPDLTATNFAKGLANYPGGNGMYGPWSFSENGQLAFTTQHSFRYEWWNPKGTSSFNQQPGTWVVGNQWYSPSQVPNSPLPVFPNGPQ